MIDLNIHIRLRQARKKLKLNQTDVAKDLNIQQKTISDIENGKILNIPNSYIYYFYDKGISLEWIYDSKGEMEQNNGNFKNNEIFTDSLTTENVTELKESLTTDKAADNDNVPPPPTNSSQIADYKSIMYERIVNAKDDAIKNLQTHIKLQDDNMEFLRDFLSKVFNKK